MSNTKEFFQTKKSWSKYKDDLLKGYLLPYLNKIMKTRKDCVFIDGFAGKGKFEDGEKGSPLIVKDVIYQAKEISKSDTKIIPYFIDYEYADVLKHNLSDINMNVISGDYRTMVPAILKSNLGKNIFLYVDPFGIKYLDFCVFNSLDCQRYNSIEMLLNFNSFGFLREGCRLLKCKIDELIEELPDTTYVIDTQKNTIDNMNRIANGDYWINIINDYNNGVIDIFRAEQDFVNLYKKELYKKFVYVFDIPITNSIKARMSKYRMIFATNHKEGAILMADNFLKCETSMNRALHNNQLWMFDYDNQKGDCKDYLYNYLCKYNTFIELKDLYLEYYSHNGIKYLSSDMNNAIKELERNNRVDIVRKPSLTEKTKKLSKSMDFNKIDIRVKIK